MRRRAVLARVSKTSGAALDIMEHAYPSSLDDEALLLGRVEIFLEWQHEAEAAGSQSDA